MTLFLIFHCMLVTRILFLTFNRMLLSVACTCSFLPQKSSDNFLWFLKFNVALSLFFLSSLMSFGFAAHSCLHFLLFPNKLPPNLSYVVYLGYLVDLNCVIQWDLFKMNLRGPSKAVCIIRIQCQHKSGE